jgi:GDP-L-fucose synthase
VIGELVGYTGKIEFDPEKPDGTPRKLLDSSRLNLLGWQPGTSLTERLRQTYSSYLSAVEAGALKDALSP